MEKLNKNKKSPKNDQSREDVLDFTVEDFASDETIKSESKESRKNRRNRLAERLKVLRERANLIELELNEYTNDFFRVCIFGSARIKPEDITYQKTQLLGKLLGEQGIDVLTGGGPGLMEAASSGVQLGKKSSGSKSKSFGITIDLGEREPVSPHLDIKVHHRKFSSRLDDFMRLSNVVIIVEGGIGTLLELFFSWQLLQVGHIPERPIILVNPEFWGGLIDWMDQEQVSRGLISPHELRWIHIVETPEEAIELVLKEKDKFNQVRTASK